MGLCNVGVVVLGEWVVCVIVGVWWCLGRMRVSPVGPGVSL